MIIFQLHNWPDIVLKLAVKSCKRVLTPTETLSKLLSDYHSLSTLISFTPPKQNVGGQNCDRKRKEKSKRRE